MRYRLFLALSPIVSAIDQFLPGPGIYDDIICFSEKPLPSGAYGDPDANWSAGNFTGITDLCSHAGNPFGNFQGRCVSDLDGRTQAYFPDEAYPSSLTDPSIRLHECMRSCMCLLEWNRFLRQYARVISLDNILELLEGHLGDYYAIPRTLYWFVNRRRAGETPGKGQQSRQWQGIGFQRSNSDCMAFFHNTGLCRQLGSRNSVIRLIASGQKPPARPQLDDVLPSCQSRSCQDFRCGTGCSCQASRVATGLFDVMGCSILGRREIPACPCNSTYVSTACCYADAEGIVWEPAENKLGIVRTNSLI